MIKTGKRSVIPVAPSQSNKLGHPLQPVGRKPHVEAAQFGKPREEHIGYRRPITHPRFEIVAIDFSMLDAILPVFPCNNVHVVSTIEQTHDLI